MWDGFVFRVQITGSWFVNHKWISWLHNQKICKTFIFQKLFFLKYDNFKIISTGDICLSISLELNEWDGSMKEKNLLDVLACFKLCHYRLTWKIIDHCMCRFFECKYNLKLTCLWRKLEFYTRVHKKCIFCCSLKHEIWDTISFRITNFTLTIGHYYLIFSQNNIFFLITTLVLSV